MPKHIGIDKALCQLLGVNPEGLTSLTLRMEICKPITIQTTGYADFEHRGLGNRGRLAQELKHYMLVAND